MSIKEYGQAASEVELQDNPGPIKNQEGEAVIEITNDQDVGIGTSNPTEKLDVAVTGANGGIRVKNATDNAYVKIDAPADEAAYIDFQTADSTDWQLTRAPNSNDLAVYDNDGGSGYMVTFEQGGNVGVGTTDPAEKVDVALTGSNGGIRVKNATDNAYVKIDAPADEAAYVDFQTGDSTDWQLTRAPNSNNLALYDNDGASDYVVTFEQGGNVGIGTTNPAAKLDVAGSIVSTGDLTLGDDKTLKSASGGTVLTIDASANITFSNNVSISTGSTINMPATVTLPNTANGSVTTGAVAVDANGKDLTVEAGSTTGGSGTNNTGTGGDLTFKPGAGKGTAVGGDVIIQTAPAGASGTTVNNYTTQMIVKESGNVGMGTTGPDRKLDILDASNPQLRLTHTDATHYTDMQVAGTGARTVANSGGAIRLDSAGDVELDSASTNATMKLLAAGTEKASIDSTSDDVSLTVATADKDFKIKGTDDSAAITAFTIDFSEAGSATFNNNIQVNGTSVTVGAGSASDTKVSFDGNAEDFHIGLDDSADNLVFGKGATLGATGTQYAALFRNTSAGNTFGGLTYVPHNVVDTGTSGTSPTVLQSSSTIILTNASGYVTLPDCAADTDIGTQFVIMNGATGDNSGAVRVQGSNKFYDTDNTSGVTANQSIDKMQAKSVICFGINKWMIIG